MSILLRCLLTLGLTASILAACEQKAAVAPSAAPAAPATAQAVEKEVTGGYEPSADERVPGITIDAAALDAALIAAEAEADKPKK